MHQHDLMLLIAALLVITSIVLLHHRRSRLLWCVAAALGVSLVVAAIVLRTPSASITEHRRTENELTAADDFRQGLVRNEETQLGSIEQIEALLASGDKPTLVELYADYGLS
jgi:hypothetical protein